MVPANELLTTELQANLYCWERDLPGLTIHHKADCFICKNIKKIFQDVFVLVLNWGKLEKIENQKFGVAVNFTNRLNVVCFDRTKGLFEKTTGLFEPAIDRRRNQPLEFVFIDSYGTNNPAIDMEVEHACPPQN